MNRIKAWAMSAILALTIAGNISKSAKASTIAAIKAQPSGTVVTLDSNPVITGIFSQPGTVNGKSYSSWAIFASDSTGSIDLFGNLPSGTTYTPTVGDAISASGKFSPFDQIPELASLTAINQVSSGNAVPSPLNLTIPQANQGTLPLSIAGYPVTIDDVMISGITAPTFGIANLTGTITDASDNSMTLFYWPTSYSFANANLFGMAVPTGPVNVSGLVDSFNGTAEFVPMTITSAVPVPEPSCFVLLGMGVGALVIFGRMRGA